MVAFKHILIVLFFLFCSALYAQQSNSLAQWEDSLKVLAKAVQSEKSEIKRKTAGEQLSTLWTEVLSSKEAFLFPFDSVKTNTRLLSEDENIKVITWLVPLDNGGMLYQGIVAAKPKKSKEIIITPLEQKIFSGDEKQFENHVFNTNNWYGCIYYTLATHKYKKKTHYLLLGWDGHERLTTRKIIEPLIVDARGRIKFGDQVFKMDKKSPKRVVFTFSKKATMSLKYYADKKQLVFDHLSPSEQHLKGQYQYYGPDFSYDAFILKKGKWVLTTDITPVNEKPEEKTKEIPRLKDEKLYQPKK